MLLAATMALKGRRKAAHHHHIPKPIRPPCDDPTPLSIPIDADAGGCCRGKWVWMGLVGGLAHAHTHEAVSSSVLSGLDQPNAHPHTSTHNDDDDNNNTHTHTNKQRRGSHGGRSEERAVLCGLQPDQAGA
jgi:hypothetical protein